MDNKKENKKRQNCFYTIFNGRIYNNTNIKKLSASYTIEASLIVPTTFIIIVAMIFLSFYLKDIVMFYSVSYKTMIEYSDTTEEVEKIIEKKLETNVLIIKDYDIEYHSKSDSASVLIKYKYKSPLIYLNNILNMLIEEKIIEVKVTNLRGRDDLLNQKITKDIISNELQ